MFVICDIILSFVVARHGNVCNACMQNARVIHCAATRRKASRKSPQSIGVRKTSVVRMKIAEIQRGGNGRWGRWRSQGVFHAIGRGQACRSSITSHRYKLHLGNDYKGALRNVSGSPYCIDSPALSLTRTRLRTACTPLGQRPILHWDQRINCCAIISEFQDRRIKEN